MRLSKRVESGSPEVFGRGSSWASIPQEQLHCDRAWQANLHWCAFFVCHPYRVMRTDDTRGHMEDLPRMVCLDSAWEPLPKEDHIKLLKGDLVWLHSEFLAIRLG